MSSRQYDTESQMGEAKARGQRERRGRQQGAKGEERLLCLPAQQHSPRLASFSPQRIHLYLNFFSLHVGQVGLKENDDRTLRPAGPSRGTPENLVGTRTLDPGSRFDPPLPPRSTAT
ncbi:hypothetical protein ILYODFUR_021739, partial [Ilyodon furcidens]